MLGQPSRQSPLGRGGGGLQGSGGPRKTFLVAAREGGAGSAALLQAQTVEQVLAKAGRGPPGPSGPTGEAPQVGGMVPQRLDRLHLLIQVMGLQEVTKLWDKAKSGRAEGLGEVRDPQEQLETAGILGEGTAVVPRHRRGKRWQLGAC